MTIEANEPLPLTSVRRMMKYSIMHQTACKIELAPDTDLDGGGCAKPGPQ